MRIKIIAGNLLIVLGLGTLCVGLVHMREERAHERRIQAALQKQLPLIVRSLEVHALHLVAKAKHRVRAAETLSAFTLGGQNHQREAAYRYIRETQDWFAKSDAQQGVPDFIALADETGRVIARDTDINRMHGRQLHLDMPELRKAIAQQEARHAFWTQKEENRWFSVAIVPIQGRGHAIIGVLIVAYELSDELARAHARHIEGEVALFSNNHIHASSFSNDHGAEIKRFLRSERGKGWVDDTLIEFDLGKAPYLAIQAPLDFTPLSSENERQSMRVLLASPMSLASTQGDGSIWGVATDLVLLFLVLMAALVLAYGFFVGNALLRAVEDIEETVFDFLNGQSAARVATTESAYAGLGYRINQLLNVMSGVEETGEVGRTSAPPGSDVHARRGMWDSEVFAEGRGSSALGPMPRGSTSVSVRLVPQPSVIDDPALAASLGAMSEALYHRKTHEAFQQAKAAAGEDVSTLRFDAFVQQLSAADEKLSVLQARPVRHTVRTVGDDVQLLPVALPPTSPTSPSQQVPDEGNDGVAEGAPASEAHPEKASAGAAKPRATGAQQADAGDPTKTSDAPDAP